MCESKVKSTQFFWREQPSKVPRSETSLVCPCIQTAGSFLFFVLFCFLPVSLHIATGKESITCTAEGQTGRPDRRQ